MLQVVKHASLHIFAAKKSFSYEMDIMYNLQLLPGLAIADLLPHL